MIAALACCLMMLAGAPPLEEDIDFQEGRRLVDDLDYERAVFRFQKLTKSDRPADQRAVVYAWLGATYANLGDEPEAIKNFVVAIKLDALVALPPSSPKVAQTFDKARQKVREEVRADADADGVVDGDDRCPGQPETINGHLDTDGCPDVPPPTDTDGDALTDDVDRCPAEAETTNGFQDDDGCPDVEPPPAPKGINTFLIGGGATAGLGLLSLAGAGALGFLAQNANATAEAAAFQVERRDLAENASGLALGSNIAAATGGTLVVVGATLMVMSMVGGDS